MKSTEIAAIELFGLTLTGSRMRHDHSVSNLTSDAPKCLAFIEGQDACAAHVVTKPRTIDRRSTTRLAGHRIGFSYTSLRRPEVIYRRSSASKACLQNLFAARSYRYLGLAPDQQEPSMKTKAQEVSDTWNKDTAARLELKKASAARMRDYELAWLELHHAGPETAADKSLFRLITRYLKAEQALAAETATLETLATSMSASITPYVKKRTAAGGRLALEFNLAKISAEDEAEIRALLLEQRARKSSLPSAPSVEPFERPRGIAESDQSSAPRT